MKQVSFTAKFYDGKTIHTCRVIAETNHALIRFLSEENNLQIIWPYKEIKLLEQSKLVAQPVNLFSNITPRARLYIEPKDWEQLKKKIPQNTSLDGSISSNKESLVGFTMLTGIFIMILMLIAPKLFEFTSYIIPKSTKEQIGQLTIESLVKAPVCTAPQGLASLNKLTWKLQKGMKRNITLNVRIFLNDDLLNAFAAPGGHLVIYSGILKKAHSSEEMAGVLAHEMAHIEMHHPMKSLMRDIGSSLTLHAMFGSTGAISSTAKYAGLISQLHYNRQDELKADLIGQELLKKASINPSGLEYFFERTKKTANAKYNIPELLQYLSTHPHAQDRIDNLKRHNTNNTVYKHALNQTEWAALKKICIQTAHTNQRL